MITTLKIIKIGKSRGIIIPVIIIRNLKLDVNDLIEIKFKKIKKEE